MVTCLPHRGGAGEGRAGEGGKLNSEGGESVNLNAWEMKASKGEQNLLFRAFSVNELAPRSL